MENSVKSSSFSSTGVAENKTGKFAMAMQNDSGDDDVKMGEAT